MGFNFNIFSLGGSGGSGSGSGITKYPTAGALPATAADGDVAIVLDTNYLYSYDTGVGAWVIIGGPGIAITVTDTASVDMSFVGNAASANLNITGLTNPPNSWGTSLVIGASGLYAYQRAYPVYGQTSSTWNTVGQSATVLGGSLLLDILPASASNSGLMNTGNQTFAGTKFFNAVVTGFSGFGMVSGAGGPGTVYLYAPNSVPSSYSWTWPSAQGGTYLVLTNDGQGVLSWSAGSSAAQTQLGPFSYVSFAQGATIFGPTFQLGWADLTNPGSVGVTTQQFQGLKLFNQNIVSPIVYGATAAAGNLILNSTNNATTVGNVLINTLATGSSGFLGIGMTTPQAGIHYAAGAVNRTSGTVGANAVIFGRITSDINVSQAVFVANGAMGTHRAGAIDAAVFGSSNSVSGTAGFASGNGNTVPGINGAAFNSGNQVNGANAFATGVNTFANGTGSFTSGEGTVADNRNCAVFGENNLSGGATNALGISNTVLVIGNGPSTGARKNAFAWTRDCYQKWYGVTSGFLSLTVGSSMAGYTLVMPLAQGGTFTSLQNDGLGNLSWATGSGGNYQTVTNSGATLALQTRYVDVTTGVTNQTLNIGYAAAGNTGVTLDVVKIDSSLGTVTIQTPDLINGATNYILSSQWETTRLVCNGVAFRVLS